MSELDQREFRNLMGNFCSGIVVVTAMCENEPVGFTAQSFVSLSLDPPLVAVCPAKTSKSWKKISGAKKFGINILSQAQQDLSNQFASSENNKFLNVEWGLSENGSPELPGSLAFIDCDLECEHDAGDHLISVGRVLNFSVGENDASPLLYFRGKYADIGESG